MAKPDPSRWQEAAHAVGGWDEFLQESQPIIAFFTEHGCTKGEALILILLNEIKNNLGELLDGDDSD